MKLKLIILLFGVAGIFSSAHSQEAFTFTNYLRDTASIEFDDVMIEKHYLGRQVAIKFYRLKDTYTYVTQGSVNNPVSQTVVEKPTIYYSLKKLNTLYKKQLKKGLIDSTTAVKELGWYFDVGYSIYQQDTKEFEQALKKAKKPENIKKVFAMVVLE